MIIKKERRINASFIDMIYNEPLVTGLYWNVGDIQTIGLIINS